ncbi:Uncharacterized protein Adt_30936 [Abeliophyllum distichum]|uniref:Uncharacterized protein n=1 Tax=Abeliophyllum distichum TaxID=126358 RepID=A0ABD1RCN0_9LAMI
MADVMSHRDAGARDPPQQPSHHLVSACKSAPPPKRRGNSRGINLEKVWQANGKMPLPIGFDIVECTMQPIKNNAKYFTRLVGNQVRFTVPMSYPSWTEVSEEQRARLRSIIEGTFPSLNSTSASKAPQGTFHQFSGDPQNNDHRFAMYEAQLRRMQWEIELLKKSILVVMPKEDENGDDDEGL